MEGAISRSRHALVRGPTPPPGQAPRMLRRLPVLRARRDIKPGLRLTEASVISKLYYEPAMGSIRWGP